MTSTQRVKKISRTFWVLTAILALIMVLVLAYAISLEENENKQPLQQIQPAVFNPQAGLGEEGAMCGGEMNLPCRPGLACLNVDSEDMSGICTKMSDKDPGRILPPEPERSAKPNI